MNTNTITAANAIFVLTVEGLFLTPVQLQGFAADDIFDNEVLAPVETLMGMDGRLSGGFVPQMVKQGIVLQADSESNAIFEAWWAAMQASREVYIANGNVTLQAVKRAYTMTRGFLTAYPPTADAKRTLMPRRYGITWESILPQPLV